MKVLIACEESQTVCNAFRLLGHEAYSCDIQECSGGHPEWHIQGDAIKEAYSGKYGMMIAHPPCTYLSNAGAVHLFGGGKLNKDRFDMGLKAKDFFMTLLNSPIKFICVENPVPSKIYELPEHSQEIQPYMFGHPFQKKTRLWLKSLPPLISTIIVAERTLYVSRKGTKAANGSKSNAKDRSKTFPGIAQAMAEQWGQLIIRD